MCMSWCLSFQRAGLFLSPDPGTYDPYATYKPQQVWGKEACEEAWALISPHVPPRDDGTLPLWVPPVLASGPLLTQRAQGGTAGLSC